MTPKCRYLNYSSGSSSTATTSGNYKLLSKGSPVYVLLGWGMDEDDNAVTTIGEGT